MSQAAIERYLKRRTSATTADLAKLGLSRASLYRNLAALTASGQWVRTGRGQYHKASSETDANTWLQVQRRYPQSVLCLVSALVFHNLTTQNPREVWLALPKSAWRKPTSYPPIALVHFSGAALTAGIETHGKAGAAVRVYSVAKTVADCFKFRNQIGLDVALEALRGGWRERRFTLPELDSMAAVCRVRAVIRPYVEALVA